MPKQVIVSMEQNYPFGECEEVTGNMVQVYVRKTYQVRQMGEDLEEKVAILRRLKNEHMIKIESVLEEEETVHFMFEYVPIKLETWISNINDQFIENFRDQLIKFSSYLANNYIKIDFQLKNIGMDHNYGAKYFLDLDFLHDRTINREKLKSNYIRQITNLFKPYIQHSQHKTQNSLDSDRQVASVDYGKLNKSDLSRRNDFSISPPTNKPPNKSKEKALEKYYQEVNMSVDSENEKILQEFMDVLDNEQEEQQHSLPPPQKQNSSITVSPIVSNSQPVASQQNNYSLTQTQHKTSGVSGASEQNHSNSAYMSAKDIGKGNTGRGNQQNQQTYSQQNYQPTQQQGYQQGQQQANLRESNDMSKNGEELQNRVKKAIEKSMDVIRKFKLIKENMQ